MLCLTPVVCFDLIKRPCKLQLGHDKACNPYDTNMPLPELFGCEITFDLTDDIYGGDRKRERV